MTNEEKAQELSERAIDYIPCNSTLPFYLNALKMAQWKDEQTKEIKSQRVYDYVTNGLVWKVDLPAFLKEITECTVGAPYARTFKILYDILAILAERSIELNDPALNVIMSNLSLYDGSHTKEHLEKVDKLRKHIVELHNNKTGN